MRIEKAIKILVEATPSAEELENDNLFKATWLGIEALKLIEKIRADEELPQIILWPLTGETEESPKQEQESREEFTKIDLWNWLQSHEHNRALTIHELPNYKVMKLAIPMEEYEKIKKLSEQKPVDTCPTCGQDRRSSPTTSCVYEHFCG